MQYLDNQIVIYKCQCREAYINKTKIKSSCSDQNW